MRRMKNNLILLAAILLAASVKLDAQINAGISMGPRGLAGFYMTVGRYFRVPQREVIIVRDRRLPDEEIPVVFFVARRAGVSPREVAAIRRQGYSWMDITYRYGLSPEIFFPGRVFQGPPYGKAWGYYRHHGRRYNISDYDIIRAVNSRMNSESCNGWGNDQRIRDRNYPDNNDMYNGQDGGSNGDYNYHNRDNQDNNSRNDDYGYGDPQNR